MAKAIRFVRDEIAITESNRPDEMIIIFSGGVTVISYGETITKEVRFHIEEPQSGYGQIALLDNELRSASMLNLDKAVFAVISKANFCLWLKKYPDIEFNSLFRF